MSVAKIRGVRSRRVLLLVALALGASACDLAVTNPGPLQDEALGRPEAYTALVEGMSMALSRAVAWIGLKSAPAAHELTGAGAGLTWGFSINEIRGYFPPGSQGARWSDAQQARWVAEDGVERFRNAMGEQAFGNSILAARALLHAGYANRLLGENMCHAVIDGGPVQPHTVHFERAERAFSEAIEVAGRAGDAQIQTAARAGRASVRAWLADWAGAASDAQQVPEDFSFTAPMSSINNSYGNVIWYTGSNQPYRSHTVFNTFFEEYYRQTQDPRVAWGENPDVPLTSTDGTTMHRWYYQEKYTSLSSPMRLSSGREMKLLVAEASLREGSWQDALDIINGIRAELGVPLWEASSAAEAWTALKAERAIELWLEARRLWDLRRWLADGSPGEMPDMTDRSTCFPVPDSEIDRNPNIRESDLG